MFACIPATSSCDGMPNCDIGEDENCSGKRSVSSGRPNLFLWQTWSKRISFCNGFGLSVGRFAEFMRKNAQSKVDVVLYADSYSSLFMLLTFRECHWPLGFRRAKLAYKNNATAIWEVFFETTNRTEGHHVQDAAFPGSWHTRTVYGWMTDDYTDCSHLTRSCVLMPWTITLLGDRSFAVVGPRA